MTILASLGIVLTAMNGASAAVHTVTVPHSSGPVRAEYRGQVGIEERQLGSPAPGGRPSTLRCVWTASLSVDRVATSAAGATAARNFSRDNLATGSRRGWCGAARAAIARDVAARVGDLDRHIALAAAEDAASLREELEGLAPLRNAG